MLHCMNTRYRVIYGRPQGRAYIKFWKTNYQNIMKTCMYLCRVSTVFGTHCHALRSIDEVPVVHHQFILSCCSLNGIKEELMQVHRMIHLKHKHLCPRGHKFYSFGKSFLKTTIYLRKRDNIV